MNHCVHSDGLITGAPNGVNRYLERMLEHLQREVAALTIEGLGDAWYRRIVREPRAKRRPDETPASAGADRLRVRGPIYVRHEAGGAVLDLEDRRLRVGGVALELLVQLAGRRAFTIAEVERSLDAEGRRVIRLLLENGLFEPVRAVHETKRPKVRRRRSRSARQT
jgi:hypothetical protein